MADAIVPHPRKPMRCACAIFLPLSALSEEENVPANWVHVLLLLPVEDLLVPVAKSGTAAETGLKALTGGKRACKAMTMANTLKRADKVRVPMGAVLAKVIDRNGEIKIIDDSWKSSFFSTFRKPMKSIGYCLGKRNAPDKIRTDEEKTTSSNTQARCIGSAPATSAISF
mmetsp:Transcript_15824/g.31887  ORF Transcript_15824/g.31887 Transcript_15824/m.31887 type:complete len:170 (+) Transcript_15824:862-1371(+)